MKYIEYNSIMYRIIILIILLIFSNNLLASDFYLGVKRTDLSLYITDTDSSNFTFHPRDQEKDQEIASMESYSIDPVIGFKTEPRHLMGKTQFVINLDVSIININTQGSQYGNGYNSLGSGIEGYSLWVAPLFYGTKEYSNGLDLNGGFGLGIGFLKVKGTFIVTNKHHKNYNETESIDISELGYNVGIFLELTNRKHSFIFQISLVRVEKDSYEYEQSTVDLIYRYYFKTLRI